MVFFKDSWGMIRPGRVFATVAPIALSLILGVSFGSCKGCNNIEYGKGQRTGVVNKISEKGYFWKTMEGQMALEGLVAGKTVGANLWDFSIDNQARHGENKEALAKLVEQYMKSGQRVNVNYIEAGATWFPRGSTSYYIQGIEPAERTDSK